MMSQQRNLFDRMEVNASEIFSRFPVKDGSWQRTELKKNFWIPRENRQLNLYRFPLLSQRTRNRIWHVLRRTNLDWSWFTRIAHYWSNVLGGRPMWSPQDLYFLRNVYRIGFQGLELEQGGSSQQHLATWQSPRAIYQLLHLAFREGIGNELKALSILAKEINPAKANIVEYGCATAPVTTTLVEFYGQPKGNIQLYDLPTLSFHYAAYKFAAMQNIKAFPLSPETNFLPEMAHDQDGIFCITVFEHLKSPLKVAEMFHRSLRPGGLLFFDYIKADADGLDTIEGAQEREEVLDFMGSRFDIIHGKLSKEESMGLTVARKKR